MTDQERHIQTVCLLILASFAVAIALFLLRSVLVPFVLATFLAYAMSPLVDMQIVRFKLPRLAAILFTLIIIVLLLSFIARIITVSVSEVAENASMYQQRFEQLAHGFENWLPLDYKLPRHSDAPEQEGPEPYLPSLTDPGSPPQVPVDPETRKWGSQTLLAMSGERVRGLLLRMARALLAVLSQSVLILIFVMFLLLGAKLRPRPKDSMLGEVEKQLRRYIIAKVLISALTGVLVGFVLWLLDVDLALMFGLMAFLFNFIPSIGSIMATLLPLPVVVLDPDLSVSAAVLAIAIPGLIQFMIGLVVEPRVMGQSLDLHPVTVLLALIFWGTIWGLVGMLLAVPMTAIVKMILERMNLTRPVAQVLAGRLEGL
jgi:AI-2 transport protein TqsA